MTHDYINLVSICEQCDGVLFSGQLSIGTFCFLAIERTKTYNERQRSTAPKQNRNNSLPIEAVTSPNTTTQPKNRAACYSILPLTAAIRPTPFQVGMSFNRFELIVFAIRDNQCKCYANIYTRPADIWTSENFEKKQNTNIENSNPLTNATKRKRLIFGRHLK